MSLTYFLTLSQGNIQRLGAHNTAVQFSDSASSFIGSNETDETEALGAAFFISHNLSGGNSTIQGEFLAQALIIDGVIQILDVQIDTIDGILAFLFQFCEFAFEFLLTFGLLLGTSHIQGLTLSHVFAVKGFDGSLSGLSGL